MPPFDFDHFHFLPIMGLCKIHIFHICDSNSRLRQNILSDKGMVPVDYEDFPLCHSKVNKNIYSGSCFKQLSIVKSKENSGLKQPNIHTATNPSA
jgi:hypothetical protein